MQQRQNFLLILKSAAGEASLDMLWHAMCAVLENYAGGLPFMYNKIR